MFKIDAKGTLTFVYPGVPVCIEPNLVDDFRLACHNHSVYVIIKNLRSQKSALEFKDDNKGGLTDKEVAKYKDIVETLDQMEEACAFPVTFGSGDDKVTLAEKTTPEFSKDPVVRLACIAFSHAKGYKSVNGTFENPYTLGKSYFYKYNNNEEFTEEQKAAFVAFRKSSETAFNTLCSKSEFCKDGFKFSFSASDVKYFLNNIEYRRGNSKTGKIETSVLPMEKAYFVWAISVLCSCGMKTLKKERPSKFVWEA